MQRLVLVSLAAVVLMTTASTVALAQGGRPGAPPPPPPSSGTIGPAKVAYIHLQEVLRKTPGYVAAESTYRRLVTGYQNELQRVQQQLDSAVQAFHHEAVPPAPAPRPG